MTYVTTKYIKGNPYLYLVRSEREGDKVRQVFVKYLGREDKYTQEELDNIAASYEREYEPREAVVTRPKPAPEVVEPIVEPSEEIVPEPTEVAPEPTMVKEFTPEQLDAYKKEYDRLISEGVNKWSAVKFAREVARGIVPQVVEPTPPVVAPTPPAEEEKPAEVEKVVRFEIGKTLTKEGKQEVLESIGDTYKDAGLEKTELKGEDWGGDPIYGYPYTPETFIKSDITGKMIRHYITLPDGRKAHPTELFPNLKQSEIDKAIFESERVVKWNEARKSELVERARPTKGEANMIFQQATKTISGAGVTSEETTLLNHPEKGFVRVFQEDDVKALQDSGFDIVWQGSKLQLSSASSPAEEEAKPKEDWDITKEEAKDEISKLSEYFAEGYRASDYHQVKNALMDNPEVAKATLTILKVENKPVNLGKLSLFMTSKEPITDPIKYWQDQINFANQRIAEEQKYLDTYRASNKKSDKDSIPYSEGRIKSEREYIKELDAYINKYRSSVAPVPSAPPAEEEKPAETKLTVEQLGEEWNRMTPIQREELGIKAGLDAEQRGKRWIEMFGEEKRSIRKAYETPTEPPPTPEEPEEGEQA